MSKFPARNDSSLFNGPPQIAMSVLGALRWSLHIQCQPWSFQWIAWKTSTSATGRSQEFHFPARNDNPANSPRNGIILGQKSTHLLHEDYLHQFSPNELNIGLRISPPGMIIPWPIYGLILFKSSSRIIPHEDQQLVTKCTNQVSPNDL